MEDSTRTKIELIRPVFLKAGIPIVISVAGFIFARVFTVRKRTGWQDSSTEFHVNSLDMEDEHILTNTHDDINSLESLQTQNRCKLEEEIVHLKSRIQDLQGRELELELRFLRFCDLKNQEMVLMELGNCLLLEMARAEFLDRELSSLEVENKRFEGMVIEFLKLLEQLQFSRLENGVLHSRILKRAKQRSGVICEQNLEIEDGTAEILQNREELERRADKISDLESKILELEIITEKLQEEKNELLNKLDLAEKLASLKIEEGGMVLEDCNQLIIELEQLQRERAAEVKELIYLRWCNACLRHELTRRRNQEQEEKQELDFEGSEEIGSERELEGFISSSDLGDSRLGCGHSKSPRLIDKFKKWVEGSEKEKHEVVKCFGF